MLPDRMSLFELLLYARLGFDDFTERPFDNNYAIILPPDTYTYDIYYRMIKPSSEDRSRMIDNIRNFLDSETLPLVADSDTYTTANGILNKLQENTLYITGYLYKIRVAKITSDKIIQGDDIGGGVTITADVPFLTESIGRGTRGFKAVAPIPITIYGQGHYHDGAFVQKYGVGQYGISSEPIIIGKQASTTLSVDPYMFGYIDDNGNPCFAREVAVFSQNGLKPTMVPLDYIHLYSLRKIDVSDMEMDYDSVFENIVADDKYLGQAYDIREILNTTSSRLYRQRALVTEINFIRDVINDRVTASLRDYFSRGERLSRFEVIDNELLYSNRPPYGLENNTLFDNFSHHIIGQVFTDIANRTGYIGGSPARRDFIAKLVTHKDGFWHLMQRIIDTFSYNRLRSCDLFTGIVAVTEEGRTVEGIFDDTVTRSFQGIGGVDTYGDLSYEELMLFDNFIGRMWVIVDPYLRNLQPSDGTATVNEPFGRIEVGVDTSTADQKRYLNINSYHSGAMRTNVGDIRERDFLSLADEHLDKRRDYIGLELEFAHSEDEDSEVYDNITEYAAEAFNGLCKDDIGQDVLRHFDFSHDSSLAGRGAEMVSLPMSLNYLKSKRATFDHIFNHMRNEGMLELGGFHIHFGRQFVYEGLQSETLIDIADSLFDVLFYDTAVFDVRSPFGRAKYEILSTYILGRVANPYCAKDVSFKGVYSNGGSHRNWLNRNHHTVEFRMPSLPFNTDDLFLKIDYIVEGINIIKKYMAEYEVRPISDAVKELRLHNIKYFKRKVATVMEDYKVHGNHQPDNTHIHLFNIQRYLIMPSDSYGVMEHKDILRAYTTLLYVSDALYKAVSEDTTFDGKIRMVWNSVRDLIDSNIITIDGLNDGNNITIDGLD